MRFDFDPRKSQRLRANPKRGIGFEEATELFEQAYWLDQRNDCPEQYLAIGWVRGQTGFGDLRDQARRGGRGHAFGHLVEIHERGGPAL